MSRFLHPRYETLEAYTPGEQPQDRAYLKLNTNESPYPPSPAVLDAVTRKAVEQLRLYSDPTGRMLCENLAKLYGLLPENVFLSNGSDDSLNFAFMAFSQNGVAFPDITYSFYPVFAALHGVSCEIIPLDKDFHLHPDDYFGQNKLLLIANPNAPTGIALTRAQIRAILEGNPDGVVVIDEAYVDFGAESAVPLLSEFPNLLVVMTYSKSRSLAGARLGFCLGDAALIADLNKLKYSTNPYNVNSLTLALGAAAVDSHNYFVQRCRQIMQTRAQTAQALEHLGFCVLPSQANFLFARHPAFSGRALYEHLKARGILIRQFDKPRIADYIRVSIGTPDDMQTFVAAVNGILEQEGIR